MPHAHHHLAAAVLGSLAAVACQREPVPAPAAPPPVAAAPQQPVPEPLAPPVAASPAPPPKPELVEFRAGARTLHGWIYKPPGPGRFPAIVFNHGSEPLPGWKPDQAEFYVAHGFVLFLPHRRGQGRSQDAGPSINTLDGASPEFVDAMVAQADDVMAGVAYAASLPYVDRRRIAAIGCSLGGIESLLAAERGTDLVAAVDFAGAAITWADNPALQHRMKLAARNAKVPVFFLQAENDFNTAPSLVLSDEMKRAGKPMRVHVFPAKGSSHMDGHGFCLGGPQPAWGPEVLDFLAAAMPK
jgi:dipeptidyl aminopeptidase/acylaminoacyl peptidase